MKTPSNLSTLVEELSAHWTDATLFLLKSAGWRTITIDVELQTWRTLTSILRDELRWQQSFRVSTLRSLSALMEQVLRKAALQIAQFVEPRMADRAFEMQVRRLAAGRRATEAERRIYAQIVREPALFAAFKPTSRTDFTPRLHGWVGSAI